MAKFLLLMVGHYKAGLLKGLGQKSAIYIYYIAVLTIMVVGCVYR